MTIDGHAKFQKLEYPPLLGRNTLSQRQLHPVIPYGGGNGYPAALKVVLARAGHCEVGLDVLLIGSTYLTPKG